MSDNPWTDKHLSNLREIQTLKTTDGKDIKVYEFDTNIDREVLSSWAKHFRNHYCDDKKLDGLRIGPRKSRAKYLSEDLFPDKNKGFGPSIRSGDFSEILVADYLSYVLEYWVPRIKYSSTLRNESGKGCDVIGLKWVSQSNVLKNEMIIYEVKARLSGDKSASELQKAIDDSDKNTNVEDQKREDGNNIRIADTLNFYSGQFQVRGMKKEMGIIQTFQDSQNNPYTINHGAAALFSNSTFNYRNISNSSTEKHRQKDNLSLIVIKGNDFMTLVHKLYQVAADEA